MTKLGQLAPYLAMECRLVRRRTFHVVREVLHVVRGQWQAGDQAARGYPGVVDRAGSAVQFTSGDLVTPPVRTSASSADELCPRPCPFAPLRPPGHLSHRHEHDAQRAAYKLRGHRVRRAPAIAQRCHVGIEDDQRHRSGEVLVPEGAQVGEVLTSSLLDSNTSGRSSSTDSIGWTCLRRTDSSIRVR